MQIVVMLGCVGIMIRSLCLQYRATVLNDFKAAEAIPPMGPAGTEDQLPPAEEGVRGQGLGPWLASGCLS